MSILLNKNSRILIQGITGHEGLFHAQEMIDFPSNVVAGVTPGKGGGWVLNGKVPVFDSAALATEATGANTSVIFVPARNAADSILEAADANIPLIICITEGIPVKDMLRVVTYLKQKGSRLIGPNCPGILNPGEAKAGIIPNKIALPGSIGLVSRSGTLTYEVLNSFTRKGLGVSSCIGVGGDPIVGTNFTEILDLFESDPHTERVALIGEIGGSDEENAADFITNHMTKPVAAFIAGQTAPLGKRMGHAGAIIEGSTGLASEKSRALQAAGVRIAHFPEELTELLA